jgi:ABC-type bacteriocin/lantibiotic exporter with double-glycine peptidase domain
MVLAYLGDNRSEERFAKLMDAEWYGVPAGRITRLAKWGYRVSYEPTTQEQLHRFLGQQIPPIIFLRTGALPQWNLDVSHAVVLVGITGDTCYYHDPAYENGPEAVEVNTFLLTWSEMDYYCATVQR